MTRKTPKNRSAFAQKIEKIVNNSVDFADLQRQLLDLVASAPDPRVIEILQQAFIAANLRGRKAHKK